jgi:hypothetical protein
MRHALCALALLVACGSDDVPSNLGAGAPDAGRPGEADADVPGIRPEGVALCYSERFADDPAILGLRAALDAGRREDRAAATEALAQAALAHPDEEQFALLHGLAALWRLVEPLPEEETDYLGQLQAVTTARRELERAYELCPTDHRIAAWLGPVLVNSGRLLGDQRQIDEGLAVLDTGIAHYPAFVLFAKLLVFADEPVDGADFQQAFAAVEANIDGCAASHPADPACTNSVAAPHNTQGASIHLGDVFAKNGRRDDALAFYAQAQREAGWASWDFQAVATDRIATLDARIAAFGDDDPGNDPPSVWNGDAQCSICHRD